MNNNLPIPKLITQLSLAVENNRLTNAANDIEAMAIWLREYRDSKNTLIAYKQCAERFYLWLQYRSMMLSEIKREDVQDYQEFLADPKPHHIWCGDKTSKNSPDWKPFVGGLSGTSINHQLSILKNMFNYLVDIGYLDRNAFALIRKRNKNKEPTADRVLEKKVIHYVLEYLEHLPIKTYSQEFDKYQNEWLVKLFFLTGMRISEVANSRMNHFIHKRDKWWLKVVGKGDKYGEIVITQELMNALVKYRRFHGLSDYPTFDDQYPTVINKRGVETSGLSANMIHRIIKSLFSKASIYTNELDSAAAYTLSMASAHWIRHASATAQLEAGVALETVKDNLRHENVETTMRYVHKNKDERHDETTNKFILNSK